MDQPVEHVLTEKWVALAGHLDHHKVHGATKARLYRVRLLRERGTHVGNIDPGAGLATLARSPRRPRYPARRTGPTARARIAYPLINEPYGYREYSARDLEGHVWSLQQPLEEDT